MGSGPNVGSDRFAPPTVQDESVSTNVEWNRQRWGQEAGWRTHDQYGYRWGNGRQQTVGEVARLADEFLRPQLASRYDLAIIELAPGSGRFTAELIRYASRMCLVDLNSSALEVCRERFAYMPTPLNLVQTDGTSLGDVPRDCDWDAVISFDSMVHMHPEVIRSYVDSIAEVLHPSGFAWLDHSGHGFREAGHRTAMTAELMQRFAQSAGMVVTDQLWRNEWDCISVLRHITP